MNKNVVSHEALANSESAAGSSRGFLAFSLLSALAEGAQQVIILWTAFQIGGSGLLVGWAVFAGYAPAAAVGLAVRKHADKGDARSLAGWSNWFLALGSLVMGVQQLLAGDPLTSVIMILASQALLSLVKLVNKAVVGRLLRTCLQPEAAKKTLQLSSSASLAGQVVGAGGAGLLLSTGLGPAGLLICGAFYAASAFVLRLAVRNDSARARRKNAEDEETPGTRRSPKVRSRLSPALVSVLLFSVPSSGSLQALTTLLPSLSEATAPSAPAFYAVMNVTSMAGGFVAGLVLSSRLSTPLMVLRWAMPASAILLVCLNLLGAEFAVAFLAGVLTLVLTLHVIVMQVLTNQTPPAEEVGSFAMTRNVVASLSKALFALAAGAISSFAGLEAAVWALAGVCAVFWLIWWRQESSRREGVFGEIGR